MKRRGAGNRSARRVICIHVRCCLATWQPRPSLLILSNQSPTPFLPLFPLLLTFSSFSSFSSCLCPDALLSVPLAWRMSPSITFLANPLPARVSTSTLQQRAARRAIEIPVGYNKVLLLSRPGSEAKGRRSKGTGRDKARGPAYQKTENFRAEATRSLVEPLATISSMEYLRHWKFEFYTNGERVSLTFRLFPLLSGKKRRTGGETRIFNKIGVFDVFFFFFLCSYVK